ncbi:MAG: UDP-glucose--hexose-1-phosphate uridylyltransferase [Ruminococcaceae bacterium]|nr:UDP-glucose--hexose-1-phosphate uridylyltransferase [Oscillospiraceae bacterium]
MIYENIGRLIDYALKNSLIESADVYVVRNMFMEAFGLTDWQDVPAEYSGEPVDEVLDPLIEYAVEQGIIADTSNSRDLFDTKLMGILTPMPREVNKHFMKLFDKSAESATDWYYEFSKQLNYVRAGRMARDLRWKYSSEYGELDITINRSKPEKDPRDIAAAGAAKSADYPKCMLCPENAGFIGNLSRPARQNLRPVSMSVHGEPWQFQYSPYGYYNEHCIVFNERHTAMKIDDTVFEKLFDIIDLLPHYFVGSNADLPIVGGSILSHEHFQGGRYTFAMEKAPIEKSFTLPQFPNVEAGIVKWPMSVIRLSSENRKTLASACSYILKKWRGYSDESADIFAETNGEPHNTITPIARTNGSRYECDLVLRNNRTTEERPLGLFHPRPELFHIKKENIGLIEVMGLAVLPQRLAEELGAVEDMLLGLGESALTAPHEKWANEVKDRHPEMNSKNAAEIIRAEVGAVFEQVLLDAGVFKRDEKGAEAFAKFIAELKNN